MEILENFEKGKVPQMTTWQTVAKNQPGDGWELGRIVNEYITSVSSKIAFSTWSMLFKE